MASSSKNLKHIIQKKLENMPSLNAYKGILSYNPDCDIHHKDGQLIIVFSCALEFAEKNRALLHEIEQEIKKELSTLESLQKVLISFTEVRKVNVSNKVQNNITPSKSTPMIAPQLRKKLSKITLKGVDNVIAVASGKGGVGKSTVTANLAIQLSHLGLRVGILDADVYGPSMPKLFNLHHPPHLIKGKRTPPPENYGIKIMSMGFLVGEETPMVWRGPMVTAALMDMLNEVSWAPLDVLLIDMPPGTGDVQLTLSQQLSLTGAIIVSTPQDLALIDARKGLKMFEKVHVPLLGIIENMSQFICPHCHETTAIFNHGGAQQEAHKRHIAYLGAIPLALEIRERSDQGKPLSVEPNQKEEILSEAYLHCAKELMRSLEITRKAAKKPPEIVFLHDHETFPDQIEKQQLPEGLDQEHTAPWPHSLLLNADKNALFIRFDNHLDKILSAEFLRVHSPSAEVQGHSPSQKVTVLNKKNVLIDKIIPIGSYAVQCVFNDGHHTGFYSWHYLYELCQNYQTLWKTYLQEVEDLS